MFRHLVSHPHLRWSQLPRPISIVHAPILKLNRPQHLFMKDHAVRHPHRATSRVFNPDSRIPKLFTHPFAHTTLTLDHQCFHIGVSIRSEGFLVALLITSIASPLLRLASSHRTSFMTTFCNRPEIFTLLGQANRPASVIALRSS